MCIRDSSDAVQHYLVCPRLLHHVAQPRGQLASDILTWIGPPTLETPFDGENGIASSATRLGVATRLNHILKDNASV
eukprot:5038030-Pyramimonas_sp.AAC.1